MTIAVPARAPDLLTIEDFELFLFSRPDGERWELVDGTARMMAPPDLRHQVIAARLVGLLQPTLKRNRPGPMAVQEAGIRIGPLDRTLLVPDVLVVPRTKQRYADDLILAVEIESPTNREGEVDGKFRRYKALPSARYCVHLQTERMSAELHEKVDDAWRVRTLEGPDARLLLPELGFDHALAEIYEDVAFD